MPKPETPLYIRLSYRFLYLLLFSLLFFYPVRESYILLNYLFSSISPTAGSHRGLWTIMTNLTSVVELLILVKDQSPRIEEIKVLERFICPQNDLQLTVSIYL
jgi:hypothetical protein